jgi:hypothetical protein
MAGFKTQTKRNREAAKLAKRQAKDQKRALRKAEKAGPAAAGMSPALAVASPAPTAVPPTRHVGMPEAAPARKPLTLAEAVERWKSTKVASAKKQTRW